MSKTDNKKSNIGKVAKRVGVTPGKARIDPTLMKQYDVIRKDILRLRDDIAKGYSMAKDWIDRRGGIRGIRTK